MIAVKPIAMAVPAVLLLLLVSCATGPGAAKTSRQGYEASARTHDEFAKERRSEGNRVMAEYHEQEAARERHNAYATDCGFVAWLISDVLLDSGACEPQ